MDLLPAHFMTFHYLGSLESKDQAVNSNYVSDAYKGTADSHRKVTNPERETKGGDRPGVESIVLKDDLNSIPADNPAESQGQDPIEDGQNPPDLQGETFYE